MAKASFVPKVTKTVETVVEHEKIALELTNDEASALLALIGRCKSGGPTSGIYHALSNIYQLHSDNYHIEIRDADISWDSWRGAPTIRVSKR